MPLSLQSRHIGPITMVTCSGRIVEGPEADALHDHLSNVLPNDPFIVLDLNLVEFIDSSGLGLLLRFLGRTQQAGGGLKLAAIAPRVAEVLRVTRLRTSFDIHDCADDAVIAFYQRATSKGVSDRLQADVLCIEPSADVLAFVRGVLKQAGYGVATSSNVPDGMILLKAMRPKVVVVGAAVRSANHARASESFAVSTTHAVVELPRDFASRDAAEAGQHVLSQVRAAVGY